MIPEEIDIATAKLVLKRATGDDLIQAASAALQAGFTSTAFSELVTDPSDFSRIVELFEKGLNDSHVVMPKRQEAVLRLSKDIAWKIIRGELTPLDGAEAIRLLNLDAEAHIVALEPFRHASFEANPQEPDRELKKYYDDMVMEAAQHLVRQDQ